MSFSREFAPNAGAYMGWSNEMLFAVRRWRPAVLVFCAVALLVHRYDAPAVLLSAALLIAGVLLLLWPEVATLLMVFLLYTNIPVVAYKYHGVPQAVAGSFMLLLLLPLVDHLFVRREPLRVDRIFRLMLLFLGVLLVASIGARDWGIAGSRILNYVIEGLLLYWLITNVVRELPTLRRVIWTVLAAGSLLGGLSFYQEVTGSFDQQFGGLAHRNYEGMLLQRQIEERPDDEELRQRLAALGGERSRRAEGPVDEPNSFARILIVLLPLAGFAYRTGGSRQSRLCALAAAALILGGIVVTYSRGGLLALGLLLLVAIWVRWIRPVHLVIGGLSLVLLVSLAAPDYFMKRLRSIAVAVELVQGRPVGEEADGAMRGRATEMLAALQAFGDHPLLGVGPGQYTPFYSVEYQQKNPDFKFRDLRTTRRAHSLYLEMAAEMGIVGLGVFLMIVLVLMRELWRTRKRWEDVHAESADLATALWLCLFAYLASSVFLHLAYERYYWFLLALGTAGLQAVHSRVRSGMVPLPWLERSTSPGSLRFAHDEGRNA